MKADTDALTGRNWMAGISGERYLNEINMPGSHDAAMFNVQGTGKSVDDFTSPLGVIAYLRAAYQAQTQTTFIDQQLNDGARVLDLRLNNMKKKEVTVGDTTGYGWADDGKSVWLCHGDNENTGCYLACDRDGELLKFDEVLEWVEEFLVKHPTETVILHIRHQSLFENQGPIIYNRAKAALNELAAHRTNKSTGEPFLYKESGHDFFEEYEHMPQLKDCRGKIVLWFEKETGTNICGGISKDHLYGDDNYIDRTHHDKTAANQIASITESYGLLNGDGSVTLPTNADTNYDFLWHWELNCTGEEHGVEYFWHSLIGVNNPVSLAKIVNPALVGNGKLFGPEIAGQYIGWVKMDAFDPRYAEVIWRTNFFDGLQYCTVTVESGVDDPRFPTQTYRLLKGTSITIPDNIYLNDHPRKGATFEGWKGSGSDKLLEGSYVVNENVTFTAQWAYPTYTVRFDSNVPANASTACAGSMDDQTIACDETMALSENAYSLPGYDFAGWNTEKDGTGDLYADKGPVKDLCESGGTVTLYAQWNPKRYKITYYESTGAEAKTYEEYANFDKPGKLKTYSDEAFQWDSSGKTLHGWSGTRFGSFYGDGDDFCNLCGAPDENGNVTDVTLTADWVQNGQIVVTVTRDDVPQEGLIDSLVLVQGSSSFKVLVAGENGRYVFDPSGQTIGGQSAQLPAGNYDLQFVAEGYPSASKSITYTGTSAVSVVFNYYTVSLAKDSTYPGFNDVEISGGASVVGNPGSKVALDGSRLGIKTTVKPGYRFVGYTAVGVAPVWADSGPSIAEQTITVQGKTVITAHVAPIEYSVTVEGGTADKTSATLGETVAITAGAPDPGKAFVQWSGPEGVTFTNASSVSTTFTMPASDVKVTAVYAPIVIGPITDKEYTGSSIEPDDEVSVSLEGVDLALTSKDFEVSFDDNVDVGDATVTVTMKSPRAGSATSTFKITPADISKATVTALDQNYDGTEHKPDPTVTWKGKVLAKGVDYEVSAYANNVHAGSATVSVTGKGNFKGTASGKFDIARKPATITVENASKVQGEDDPAFSGAVDGLVDAGDLGEVRYVRKGEDEDPGTYKDVLSAEYAANSDYDVSIEKGDFTIRQRLTVKWLDGDGSLLKSKDYGKGDEPPTYDGKEPTKVATAQYTYKFTGWDGGTADGTTTTYKPLFSETINTYKVTFVDYDGTTVLKEAAEYDYGTPASEIARPSDPTRAADAQYTYTFAGWTPDVVDVTADAVYTAVYESGKRSYEVTWLQDDDTLIDKTTAEYGEKPAHADPTKAATAQYTYKFTGWTPEIVAVTGSATYKATYTQSPVPAPAKKGILTFDLGGGTLDGKTGTITIEANVGDVIKLPGAPTREGYTFKYWKGSKYEAGAEYVVKGDHAFTAEWEQNGPTPEPVVKHTVTFDANGHGTAPDAQQVEDGKTVSKPSDPKADGWTFGGWYTDKKCTKAYDFSQPVTADVTLYAKWTQAEGTTKGTTSGSSSASRSGTSSATSTRTTPRTGDDSGRLVFVLSMMAICALCLGLFARLRRRS